MHDPTARFGGVDWATDTHAVCVVDGEGGVVAEFVVEDTADGLSELCRRLCGVARVAIERPDGPVVDALMDAGFEVVVVSSRSVKALRQRYGTAGNKSDRSDAYVLADCLRTDGHRWQSLKPDTPATVTLRSHVRARKDLVEARVAVCNQLRADGKTHQHATRILARTWGQIIWRCWQDRVAYDPDRHQGLQRLTTAA